MPESREQAPVATPISPEEINASSETDRIPEACGVFGIVSCQEGAVWRAYDAAQTMVNRGDQGTGVGVVAEGRAVSIANEGTPDKALQGGRSLEGYSDMKVAIAHTLYATQEDKELQPIEANDILLAHNGNILNKRKLAEKFDVEVTESMTDSGILARAIGNQKQILGSTEAALEAVLPKVRGAFSIVILEDDRLIAVRDRVGYRPLSKGELADGGWAVASETPVFDMIGAEFDSTVAPGTYEVISANGIEKVHRWGPSLHPEGKAMVCGMGLAYFERADGQVEEIDIAESRERMGEFLAEDYPVEADMVLPFPDSGRQAATGIAKVLKLVLRDGFYKNHVVGKTYIKPVDQIKKAVKIKLNPIRSAVRDRRVIAVDDSIVRGNTSADSVRNLTNAGATEVHMRIAFPPIKHPCHFGMNMKKGDGLLAEDRTIEEMRRKIEADSLAFNTPKRFAEAVGRDLGSLCMGCATGAYPEDISPSLREDTESKELALV